MPLWSVVVGPLRCLFKVQVCSVCTWCWLLDKLKYKLLDRGPILPLVVTTTTQALLSTTGNITIVCHIDLKGGLVVLHLKVFIITDYIFFIPIGDSSHSLSHQ